MGSRAEQTGDAQVPGRSKRLRRKEVKRDTVRKMRRLAKRDPEGAPVQRPTKGWND